MSIRDENIRTDELLRQNPAVETAPLQEELILFHSQLNRFFILNCTSSFIWSQLQLPVSVEQVARNLCARFDGISMSQALEDVRQAFADLVALDLAIISSSQPDS
jgi:Coenzyme PQQ synthesis protein D (PqqD)